MSNELKGSRRMLINLKLSIFLTFFNFYIIFLDNNEFKKEIDTSDSDIEKECIKVEDEKAELLNFISKIRKSIITQDLKFLLNSLIKFEAKYLKKVT